VKPENKTRALDHAVAIVRKDPFFLGHALAEFESLRRFDDKELVAWLGCASDSLSSLSLCRMPTSTEKSFLKDVRAIAEFASCNPDRLAQLLREVGAVSAIREGSRHNRDAFLMAARDGEKTVKQPGDTGKPGTSRKGPDTGGKK
jgi:hypothetical protein